MMDGSTRLRTMTLKSPIKFGQFYDHTVGDLIILHKKDYLTWCYYFCSQISFNDEVLDILGISKEYQIQKPGKNEDIYPILKEIFKKPFVDKALSIKERTIISRNKKKIRKARIIQSDKKISTSMEKLMNINRNKIR